MLKKYLFSLVFVAINWNINGQITNSTINYEVRADQYWQNFNNTNYGADNNEVKLTLYGDWYSGGVRTWSVFGASCSGLSSTYYWSANAPTNSTANLNLLLLTGINRVGNPSSMILRCNSWEEAISPDCSSAGNNGAWQGDYTLDISSNVKRPSLWWGPDDIAGSEWINEDWTNQSGRNGDAKIKSVWRYTYGTDCSNPLDFGTLVSGVTKTHLNSNRSTPSGSTPEMGYTNISGNTSNDVFYSFTTTEISNVTISTVSANTNYDTYISLYNEDCSSQITFNDDFSGNQSQLTTQLCPGTYKIQVEGYASNSGDFELSIVSNSIALNPGTITFSQTGAVNCIGTDPGNINNTISASGSFGTLSYQWQASTVSGTFGFVDIPVTTAFYYLTTISQTTWFRRVVYSSSCANPLGASNVVQISVEPAVTPITGVDNTTGNSCELVRKNLSTSGVYPPVGTTTYWYTGPNGTGTLLGTGSSISVIPSATTNYYVHNENTTCGSSSEFVYTLTITPQDVTGKVAGDYLWVGNTSDDWNIPSNWLIYNGTNLSIATLEPTLNNNVFLGGCSYNFTAAYTQNCFAKGLNILGASICDGSYNLFIPDNGRVKIAGSFDVTSNNCAFFMGDLGYLEIVNSANTNRHIFVDDNIDDTLIINNLVNNSGTDITINSPVKVEGSLELNGFFKLNEMLILGYKTYEYTPTTITLYHPIPLITTPGVGWIHGPNFLRRYTNSTVNTGTYGLYPLGSDNGYYRGAKLQFNTAPTGNGYIDTRFVNTPLTFTNGLPIINDAGVTIIEYMNYGYWEIAPSNGFTLSPYTLKLRYDGVNNTTPDQSDLRIVKSPNPHTMWIADGIHGSVIGTEISRTNMSGFSWFVINSVPFTALGSTFENLSVNCSNDTEVLSWSTINQGQEKYFTIERRTEDSNWQLISTIATIENSATTNYYSYSDEHPLRQDSYYRVSEIDDNGTIIASEILQGTCLQNSSNCIIYPNPSKGVFNIELSSITTQEDATITILDAFGKEVYRDQVILNKGTNQLSIQASYLNSGTYFIKMHGNRTHLPVQLIIIQ